MEFSTITTDRLGSNDSLQFSPSKNNLTAVSSRMNNMEQQQQQQQQANNSTDLKSPATKSISCNSSMVNNSNTHNKTNNDTNCDQHHENNGFDQFCADIKHTLESLLDRIDSDSYPIVTATTSQSLIYDSCTKVSLISPVKDEDLNKSSDIVMLRNLEITPPPMPPTTTPSPNLNKDIDESATNSSSRKRRASQRTQSEQSDESSSTTTTTGRSKRQRKQTELFQAQSDKKTLTPSSSRKSRPEPKPQIKAQQEEPRFQDVILYEKGDYLAIRNEENTFFVCQLIENVRIERSHVRIRWLDTVNDNKTYFLTSHYDKIPQKSIIMPVTLEKLKTDKKSKQEFTIDDQIKNTVMDRLKRSLNVPAEE